VPLTDLNSRPFHKRRFIPRHLWALLGCKAPLRVAACDWTGSGVIDLIVSSNWWTSLLQNIGTNRKPVFKLPKAFKTPDGRLVVSHHESNVAVWDFDGDGSPDLVIGGESSSLYLFHHDWLTDRPRFTVGVAPP